MYYRKQFITTYLQLVTLTVTNSLYEVALVTFSELFFNFYSHISLRYGLKLYNQLML